ncbi:MAG: hypothetical protein AAGK17_00555 [Pseudomonadota bacterium]
MQGESRLLNEAIADFSENGARREYASWLLENGETHRANAVLATIEAYQSLDPKVLSPWMAPNLFQRLRSRPLNESWKNLVGLPLLQALCERSAAFNHKDISEFKEALFSALAPSLALDYTAASTDPPIGTSRLWGEPDLPEGFDWPTIAQTSNWSDCRDDLPQDHPCSFVGLFAFQDFSETVLGQRLPEHGGFLIFSIDEVHEVGIREGVALPWLNQAPLIRTTTPQELVNDKLGDGVNAPQPIHDIIMTERLSLPDASYGPFSDQIRGCKWGEPFFDLYQILQSASQRSIFGMGGYLHGTTGSDRSPDENHRRLITMRTHPDVGTLHFAIPACAMHEGNIDEAQCVWLDWDS